MKTILVTGGAGFIGSNLVHLLVKEQGHRVVNVDKLTYAGNPGSLQNLSDLHTLVQADIADAAAMKQVFADSQPDAVMHLAAESHVDRSIDGPGAFIRTNLLGTFELLQASLDYFREMPKDRKQTFRFLHVSTDEVYGSLGVADPGFSETTPYDPHSPYSASKAGADHLVRAWGDTYGLPVLITNGSNNYGPYQFPEKLIPMVILKCLRNEAIPVYGKGDNIRDWLYVEDHTAALYTVLTRGTPGETYHIGGNNERTNLELVQILCRLLDELHPGPAPYADNITFVKDRPAHDKRYAVDSGKIRDGLGWEPAERFESGLRKTVIWYLEHRDWWEPILSGTYSLNRLGLPDADG